MVRTTVYLDAADKRELAALAATTGISEAELIRRGVRLVVEGGRRARPRAGYVRTQDGRAARDSDALLRDTGFGR
ncbi:MAG: ribbon-helix-helix domain-containing protein [Mycobacteriales bacterium]